jgi:type II secretion system protein J
MSSILLHRIRRAGFTLIELLVAMAIVALILTALVATLQGTLKAHDDIEIEMAAVRDGPRILDMVESDLKSIHLYNMKDRSVLLGKSDHPGGLRGDRIDFVCQRDSVRRLADPVAKDDGSPAGVSSSVNEVGYRLRPSSFSQDFLELWRREDLYVDDLPFEGGVYEKIHDRVAAFQITYLSALGDKADEFDDWDMTQKKELPAAIRVHLELQASPELVGGFVENKAEERKIYSYDRVIAFAEDTKLALGVRPYLPTKIVGRGAGAGGGNQNGAGGLLGANGGAGPLGSAGQPGADPNGGGEGRREENMREHGGGNTLIDMKDKLQQKHQFNVFDSKNGGIGPLINNHNGGNLSAGDQKKLEDFMNDYRNQFGQGSFTFGGFGGASSGGH